MYKMILKLKKADKYYIVLKNNTKNGDGALPGVSNPCPIEENRQLE